MTVSCQIDSDTGIVHTTVQAPANAREIVEAIAMAVASPAFRLGLNGVADLRKATAEYSQKDLRWIADLLRALAEQIGPSRTAIIVSDDALHALARDFQSMSSGISIDGSM